MAVVLLSCGGRMTGDTAARTTRTVGGTVTGLASGASLVLRSGGGNDLAVSANGAFAFGTPMMSGVTYAVTVLTQPTSPAQNCSVANGTGMMGSANVMDVAVTACLVTNGTMGAQVGAGTSGLATAMATFVGSAVNRSGVQLAARTGEMTMIWPSVESPSGELASMRRGHASRRLGRSALRAWARCGRSQERAGPPPSAEVHPPGACSAMSGLLLAPRTTPVATRQAHLPPGRRQLGGASTSSFVSTGWHRRARA
jgi:hypothetical protein